MSWRQAGPQNLAPTSSCDTCVTGRAGSFPTTCCHRGALQPTSQHLVARERRASDCKSSQTRTMHNAGTHHLRLVAPPAHQLPTRLPPTVLKQCANSIDEMAGSGEEWQSNTYPKTFLGEHDLPLPRVTMHNWQLRAMCRLQPPGFICRLTPPGCPGSR